MRHSAPDIDVKNERKCNLVGDVSNKFTYAELICGNIIIVDEFHFEI